MSDLDRRDHWRAELAPDPDAMIRLSRALDMARRRLRYRVGAAVMVAVALVVALVLVW